MEGVGASQLSHSYASLIHAEISTSFKGALHYNFGKSGAGAEEVLREQVQQAIAVQPDLVTLSVGANDILRHTGLGSFRRSLTGIVERLQAQTRALIVITNIPNFSLLRIIPTPLKPFAKLNIQRFNATVARLAATHHLIHIDAFRLTTLFIRQFPNEIIYKDGFHPSDFGYALWANTIMTSIEAKLAALKHPHRRFRRITP